MIWYKGQNIKDDIMVSTRIRLARNLAKYPFPRTINKEDAASCVKEITEAVNASSGIFKNGIRTVEVSGLDIASRKLMVEKHLISKELSGKGDAYVMIDADEEASIMLMEEDHIRIQIIKKGFDLKNAFDYAMKIDDAIEEKCRYAFSEKFGYLTSCPTNTGTGMRASVMMHLPALTMTDNIRKIVASASKLGLTVRGLYGEGSKAYGCLYQLSNEVTLGISETEIIEKLENIAGQIKKLEEDARESLKINTDVRDRVWRSLGTLRYARKVTSLEAKSLLSDYIFGVSCGIIDEKVKESPIELMVLTEPESISIISGEGELTPEKRDEIRAELLRKSV